MKMIRLISDPQPKSRSPQFVKDAYPGLVLVPVRKFEPGELESYPRGSYIVTVAHLLEKMKIHNPAAHEWLAQELGTIDDAIPQGIRVPIPMECCIECTSTAVN